MKERPILFSGPMVRALLDGSKTQTRRIAKFKPREAGLNFGFSGLRSGNYSTGAPATGFVLYSAGSNGWNDRTWPLHSPYGLSGDRLWVRETHAEVFEVDIPAGRPAGPIGTSGSPARPDWKGRYVYAADGPMPNVQWHHVGDSQPVRWTPSIHMPRAASRITLEVTGVCVERLQDISETDAIAEGIRQHEERCGWVNECTLPDGKRHFDSSAYGMFRQLWESINGAESWTANPWVWVVEFKRAAA